MYIVYRDVYLNALVCVYVARLILHLLLIFLFGFLIRHLKCLLILPILQSYPMPTP